MNLDTSSTGDFAHESEDDFVTQIESLRFQLERCAAMLTGDLDEAVSLAQSAISKAWESRDHYQPARLFIHGSEVSWSTYASNIWIAEGDMRRRPMRLF